MSLLTSLIPSAISVASKYAKSRQQQTSQPKPPKSPFTVMSDAKPTGGYSLPTSTPSIGTTTSPTTGFGIKNAATSAAKTMAAPTPYTAGGSWGTKATPTPSSVNTAAPSTSVASGSDDYWANYMKNEGALLSSGNKGAAIANSQDLTGTAPKVQTATIPTPASAGASAAASLNASSIQSLAQENLKKLQDQYLATLTPSAREQELQKELTDLEGAARLGISNEEGQGRLKTLNLVQGRQGKLAEQANIQSQTISSQLNNEIANRTAQGQVYGTQLEFEQQNLQREQEQIQQDRKLEFDLATNGYQLVTDPSQVNDPNQVVQIGGKSYLAPTAESKLYEVNGSLVNERGEVVYQGPASTSGGSNYQYVAGNANSPGGIFDPNTGQFMANPAQVKEQSQLSQDASSLIGSLINHPGMAGATGGIRVAIPGSQAANFNAELERLKALLSLDNIQYLKGTGAMSDREFATLSSAAAALDPKMSTAAFKAELERIQRELKADSGGDDLDQWLNSFSNDLSTSLNGSFGDLNSPNNLPKTQTQVTSLLGQGVITGYGSAYWKPGLDFVLPGGKSADVRWPTQFEVISLDPESKTGGFGNRAKIRTPDGKEMWVSHLSNFNTLQPGRIYPPGTSLGKQGNTGNTYGKTGIHLDLTMPKPGGGYYTAEQVASYLKASPLA